MLKIDVQDRKCKKSAILMFKFKGSSKNDVTALDGAGRGFFDDSTKNRDNRWGGGEEEGMSKIVKNCMTSFFGRTLSNKQYFESKGVKVPFCLYVNLRNE